MAFWTYMLRCSDRRFYVGHTDALEQRIAQHRQGGFCDFTARRQPVALVWSESFPTRHEALACERQLKRWTRAKKEALIRGDWERLSWLAKPPAARPSTTLRTNGQGEEAGKPTDAAGERTMPHPVRPELVEGRAPGAAPAARGRAP